MSGNNFLFTGQGVASNAPSPGDTEVISLQKINANLYALVSGGGGGGGGGVTSFNTRTGAVTLVSGDIPNNAANTTGSAGSVALANITGAGAGVLSAAANASNASGGLPVLDARAYLSIVNELSNPLRLYQPTTNNAGTYTVTPFNVVCVGDSITAGGGASIPYQVYAGAPATPQCTGWTQSLQNLGFCSPQATIWPLGLGGQVTSNALAQFYNSQGQTCSVALTNASTSGTLQATPQFIESGAIVTGAGIPANTTMTNTQVKTTMTAFGSGSNSITVANGSSVVNGMYVAILSANGVIYNASFAANTTVSSGGGTNTLTLSSNLNGGNSYTGANVTVIFYSPTVTLSNAYTGTTGTQTLTSGGTLITSTATFTAGSVTATVTGTTTGLTASAMGVGGTAIVPGSTATFSGTTMTLSAKAKTSGSATFYASCITHDAVTNAGTTFYPNGINTTPYLLSPNVTGVPGYFLCLYGINDSNTINNINSSTWMTSYYGPLIQAAISAGYTACYLTIPPPCANNIYSGSPTGVATYNALLKSAPSALNGAYLIDIASQFPPNNPNIGDVFHTSDGLHPSDLGHRAMAGYINDSLFSLFANSTNTITYPLGNGGLNEYWLPAATVKNDQANILGTPPVNGGTSGVLYAQQIAGSLLVSGDYGTSNGSITISGSANSNSGGNLYFAKGGYGSSATNAWTVTGANSGNFTITDAVNGGGLTLPSSPTSNAATFTGPLTIGGGSAATATSTMTINRNAVAGLTFGLDISNDGYVYWNQGYGTNDGFKWSTGGTNRMTLVAGQLNLLNVGKTLTIKGGANGASGTVTLASGAATITSTAITTSSVIMFSLKTSSGTPGIYMPGSTVSAGSAAVTGLATDNSTYNWAMILANQ